MLLVLTSWRTTLILVVGNCGVAAQMPLTHPSSVISSSSKLFRRSLKTHLYQWYLNVLLGCISEVGRTMCLTRNRSKLCSRRKALPWRHCQFSLIATLTIVWNLLWKIPLVRMARDTGEGFIAPPPTHVFILFAVCSSREVSRASYSRYYIWFILGSDIRRRHPVWLTTMTVNFYWLPLGSSCIRIELVKYWW